MLFACEPVNSDGGTTGELRIVSDKDVIQANGTDASTITVMLGDKDVTSKSVIFNEIVESLIITVEKPIVENVETTEGEVVTPDSGN